MKNNTNKKRNYIIIAVIFIIMLAISMSENAKGVFVPLFKTSFLIGDKDIGLVFFIGSCSYMLASYIAGYLIDIINRKRTLILGAVFLLLGTYTLATTKLLILFYFSFIFSNMGMAFMALCVNTLIPKIKVKNAAVLMNLVHFVYGVGAAVTHKSCGILLAKGLTYGQIYYILLFVTSLVFIAIVFSNFNQKEEHKETKTKDKVQFHSGEKILIVIMALGLGLYIAAEIQTGNWLVDYIKNSFGYSENVATNYSFLFFLFFALGRLFGGIVAEKIGYLKSVMMSTSLATIIYLTGLILESKGLILISISGVFFSIVFPVIMLSINDYYKEKLNKASGIIITIASGTNMLMGYVIGSTSDIIGIQKTMYIIPILLFVSTILVVIVNKKGYNLVERS